MPKALPPALLTLTLLLPACVSAPVSEQVTVTLTPAPTSTPEPTATPAPTATLTATPEVVEVSPARLAELGLVDPSKGGVELSAEQQAVWEAAPDKLAEGSVAVKLWSATWGVVYMAESKVEKGWYDVVGVYDAEAEKVNPALLVAEGLILDNDKSKNGLLPQSERMSPAEAEAEFANVMQYDMVAMIAKAKGITIKASPFDENGKVKLDVYLAEAAERGLTEGETRVRLAARDGWAGDAPSQTMVINGETPIRIKLTGGEPTSEMVVFGGPKGADGQYSQLGFGVTQETSGGVLTLGFFTEGAWWTDTSKKEYSLSKLLEKGLWQLLIRAGVLPNGNVPDGVLKGKIINGKTGEMEKVVPLVMYAP